MKYFALSVFLVCAHAETLHYTINWQSGLSLGEATLTSGRSTWVVNGAETAQWNFDLDVDASVPGFAIRDHYVSSAGPEICSAKLERTLHRGSHKSEEVVTFDQAAHSVTRGDKTESSMPACVRDGLSFLQFARQELAQGRLAPQQSVILGAAYNVRLEFAGTEKIKKLGQMVDADRIHATIRGPASDLSVDIFFGKDEARTPLAARIPLTLGTFSVELAH